MTKAFTVGEAIQQVAVHAPYAAVACGCFVQLLRVDGDHVTTECNLEVRHGTSSTFTVTDVAFNPASPERLAVSTTNGAVVVFNTALCAPSASAPSSTSSSAARAEEWRHADESARAIHKVAWHCSAPDILAAACAEGTVKVFDVRAKPAPAPGGASAGAPQVVLTSRADATRDVAFDPFHNHILAAVFENGSLAVWDQRFVRPHAAPYATSSSAATAAGTAGGSGAGAGAGGGGGSDSAPWLKIAAHTNSVQVHLSSPLHLSSTMPLSLTLLAADPY